jgi:splicing factor 3A subunit 2
MTDRQNRVKSSTGGGGLLSGSQQNAERKERLRRLALETIDLNKDPYFMRNHLGTYECKLCMSIHGNEGNYLAHTQGKRHQTNLARRAKMDAKAAATTSRAITPITRIQKQVVRIGKPAYKVTKCFDPKTGQHGLFIEAWYPEAEKEIQPRHRFMSAFEQRVETADRAWQYVVFACDPYENIGFKIPNAPIDRGEERIVTQYEAETGRFSVRFFYQI